MAISCRDETAETGQGKRKGVRNWNDRVTVGASDVEEASFYPTCFHEELGEETTVGREVLRDQAGMSGAYLVQNKRKLKHFCYIWVYLGDSCDFLSEDEGVWGCFHLGENRYDPLTTSGVCTRNRSYQHDTRLFQLCPLKVWSCFWDLPIATRSFVGSYPGRVSSPFCSAVAPKCDVLLMFES